MFFKTAFFFKIKTFFNEINLRKSIFIHKNADDILNIVEYLFVSYK